jgi:putative transposase
MPVDPMRHHRHSLRLPGYDYRQLGFYFVTICTRNHDCVLGSIVGDKMYLNDIGCIVQSIWNSLPERFTYLGLDQHCVMPNHLHGILVLEEPSTVPLGSIVRAFKGAATRQIRETGKPAFAWQDDFYERIVRDDRALARIRQYILDNPARWTEDRFYAGTR